MAKEHPRLDEDRIGMLAVCFGGGLAVQVVSRMPDLPIRCMELHRCVDVLGAHVGLKMPDGSLVHPLE